jgi:hypothetical protein
VQGPADVDVEFLGVLPPRPEALVQLPEVVGFLLVAVESQRFPEGLWELVDLVFDDGEFVGLVDVLPASIGALRRIHNKIIARRYNIVRHHRNLLATYGRNGCSFLN